MTLREVLELADREKEISGALMIDNAWSTSPRYKAEVEAWEKIRAAAERFLETEPEPVVVEEERFVVSYQYGDQSHVAGLYHTRAAAELFAVNRQAANPDKVKHVAVHPLTVKVTK